MGSISCVIYGVEKVPSSYLKAMQLTKQLEEKAKETTKTRQLAEEELQASEKALEVAQAASVKVDEAKELFQQATAAFDDKEYKNALSLATRSKEVADKQYSDYSMEIINSAAKLLETVQQTGKTSETSVALLEEAKKVLIDKDFDKAISLSKECWKDLEKIILEQLSEEFSSAQSMIVLARNSGEDIASSETLLENAREYMNSQDYQTALENLKQCISGLNTGIQAQIDEMTDEARGFLISAKELDADVTRIEELLGKIDEEQEAKELEKALSTSRLCKSEAEKTLSIAISFNIEDGVLGIDKAETIKADTEKAQEILNRARNALKNSNYAEALNALKDSSEEIQNTQFQKVLETISQSRSKFLKAKKYGADLDEAIDFLNKAREALKDSDFLEALQMAHQGDKVVDEIINKFDQIEDKLNDFEGRLTEATEMGVDITEAQELFKKAMAAFEKNNTPDANQYGDNATKILDNTLHSFITDRIETAELVISAGDSLGAILDEPNDYMHNAIKAVKEGEFKIALEEADRSINRAEEIIKIHVSNTIASADLALQEVSNVNEAEIEDLISKAKAAFEKNAYDESFGLADKALSMMETAQSAKSKESISKMERAVKTAIDMNCELESLDQDMKMSYESMKSRDFQTALELAERVYKNTIQMQKVTAEKEFSDAKIEVIEAKKLGIDINEMRDALKRAKGGFEKGDYKATFMESNQTLVNAKNIIQNHQAAYEAMTQAAAMIAEAKKGDADVKKVMETLMEAKSAFEKADYGNAKELADKVKEETHNIVSLYTSANNLATARKYMTHLETLSVDINQLSTLIDETKTALKNKDVKSAMELSSKVEGNSLDLLNSTITNLISEAESAIIDAKDIGIDVSSPSSKMDNARVKLTESDFKLSIELAMTAKEEVLSIKELSQNAGLKVKDLQDKVSESENLYADIADAKGLLNQAMNELRNHDYEKTISLSEEGLKEADRAVEKHIADTISTFRVATEKAKMDGTTVVAAEKLLDKAKDSFEKKDYKSALELAMRSEGELEKVGLQQDMAAKAIKTAETKLDEANKSGIVSRQAKNLLDSARKDITNGDYVKALEHAIQSGDELYKVREEFSLAEEQMELLKTQIDTAVEIGVEISLAKKLQVDAENAMTGHDYKTAQEIAKEALVEGRRLTYSKLSSKITDTYKQIDLGASLNLDMEGLSSAIAEAKTFMENGKFKISNDKISAVSSEAKAKLDKHVTDFITNSEASANHAKDIGVDISNTLELLAKAKASLGAGKYKTAMDQAKESISKISDLQKGIEKEFIELTYKANSIISGVKKFGINVKEAEDLFKEGREIKAEDQKKAMSLVQESIRLAQSIMDEFRPQMVAKITDDRVTKNHWVDTEITLTNNGKSLGTDISIKMLGDIEYHGDIHVEKLMGNGNQVTIPIKIKFADVIGSQPVIFEITSHRVLDNEEFVDKTTASIVVVEELQAKAKAKDSSFEKLKAAEDLKCNICMGTAKKGQDIIKCNCGKEYHDMCASRFGKCASCGNSFSEKLGEDAEKDIVGDLGDTTDKAAEPKEEAKAEEPKADTQPEAAKKDDDKPKKEPKKEVKRIKLKI